MTGLTLAQLPATIPVFPLPGVLLLPGGRLPLNVFEPRYLAMTDDALASPARVIGMIQPSEAERPGHPPTLYRTGCAGRIVSLSETEDGRYLITLAGICRFTIGAEIPTTRGYRRVEASYAPWADDLAPQPSRACDRGRLMVGMRAYFKRNGIKADWGSIEGCDDSRLVTMLAMICPFEPGEKQALLECPTLVDRARTMAALFEMSAPGDQPRH